MSHFQLLIPLFIASYGPGSLLVVISDSGRYFEMSLSVSPGRVANDPSLIVWSRGRLVWQSRI